MTTRILIGSALDILQGLEAGSVHCSVTSPPYFGLRRYQGDQACGWPGVEYSPMPGVPPIVIEPMTCALGHESTVGAYIGHLVAVYRQIYRVLRNDGCCWIVMGDSYVGYKGANYNKTHRRGTGEYSPVPSCHNQGTPHSGELKAGDLMLVPHRLALALQADSWVVRNDVVWAKKAPMPESVAGWRWQRHKVKVKGGNRGQEAQRFGAFPNRPQQDHDGKEFAPSAEWTDCPGCAKCEANPVPCPDCRGTGTKWPDDPDVPMSNEEHRAYCEANPCPECGGKGKLGGYVLRRGSWRHTRAHEFVFL